MAKAKIYVTVKVTKGDIARGNRGTGYRCPIALAIKRRLKVRCVHVDSEISVGGERTKNLSSRRPHGATDSLAASMMA